MDFPEPDDLLGWTPEWKCDRDWQSYPLFMDKIDLEDTENEDLVGLKEMLSETTEEVIGEWKEQGNFYYSVATKRIQEGKGAKAYLKKAEECYSNGIREKADCNDGVLLAVLYTNRAAVHLLLQNYGNTVADAQVAIQHDPKNLKAFWRAAKASNQIKKYDQAEKFCREGLLLNPKSKELLAEKTIAVEANLKIQQQLLANQQMANSLTQKKREMLNILEQRSIKMGPYLFANLQHFMKQSKIYFDKEGQLHWPVVFIYEEYKQIDFIQDFSEEHAFCDHLQVMFPEDQFCEWDVRHEYRWDNLQVHVVLNQVTAIGKARSSKDPVKAQLNPNAPLGSIISHGDYVVPGIPVFYIVPSTGKYLKEWEKLPVEALSTGY